MASGLPFDFLLLPVGSAGDVHPFVGLGRELRRRGHRVTIATNGAFESLIRGAGLEFEPTGTREEFLEAAMNPDLWHPTRAFPYVLRSAVLPSLRPMFDLVTRFAENPNAVVVYGSLAFGARVAEDKLKIPMAEVHLQPALFRSVDDPPALPGLTFLPSLPKPLVRFFYALIARVLALLGEKPINDFRAEVGLPPVRGAFGAWWHSPRLTLGLFPPWFAPPQKDWPSSVRLTGFPLYDAAEHAPLSPELEKFLGDGEPPIVFTAGSAMRIGHEFFAASLETIRRLRRRAVIVTAFPEQLMSPLPPGVITAAYAPFSALLPRASVFVHHGGIGTTAQALAAGVPQLVVPFSHDQPDNAARVRRLGAGLVIPARRYRPRRAARRIAELDFPPFHARCAEIAKRFDGQTWLADSCDLLETLGRGDIEPANGAQPLS